MALKVFNPARSSPQLIQTHNPMYKGNVCYEETAYGCKDQYGVLYPVSYNTTMEIRYKNTELPAQALRAAKKYLMNIAESITMRPDDQKPAQSVMGFGKTKILNASVLIRPLSNMVCVEDSTR